jgi:hypothetical protein
MRLNSNRDSSRSVDPNAYWRRRFFILGGGLAVLMLLAWLFSGSGGASPAGRSATAGSSPVAKRTGDALPAPEHSSTRPGYEPTHAASAAPSASPSAATAPAAQQAVLSQSPSLATGTSAAASGGSSCASGGIVLSLFTSRPSYGQGAWPQFDVYAVSTAKSPCVMTYGAGAVRVVVTRNGQVVWDSAACGLPAAKTVHLQFGVPDALTIRWNRRAAGPSGCAGSLSPGASGTFDAVAMTAGQTSQVHAFRLLG